MESFLKQVFSVITPDSLAFIQNEEKKYTLSEVVDSEEIKKLLEPADIIISRTPSKIYNFFRNISKS